MELIHGDCRDVLQELIDNNVSVDLTVTSPPYDNLRNYDDSLEWNMKVFKEVANLLYEITTDGGIVVWIIKIKQIKGLKLVHHSNKHYTLKKLDSTYMM